jgi:hypothetical protein
MNLLKQSREKNAAPLTLKGRVRFIHNHTVLEGTIFGKPYKPQFMAFDLMYHIVIRGKVCDVPAHAIEAEV